MGDFFLHFETKKIIKLQENMQIFLPFRFYLLFLPFIKRYSLHKFKFYRFVNYFMGLMEEFCFDSRANNILIKVCIMESVYLHSTPVGCCFKFFHLFGPEGGFKMVLSFCGCRLQMILLVSRFVCPFIQLPVHIQYPWISLQQDVSHVFSMNSWSNLSPNGSFGG